jgi:hypothetical protein
MCPVMRIERNEPSAPPEAGLKSPLGSTAEPLSSAKV